MCSHILAACRRELTYSARKDHRTITHRFIAQQFNTMLSTAAYGGCDKEQCSNVVISDLTVWAEMRRCSSTLVGERCKVVVK